MNFYAKLTEIPKQQVLYYLGYRNQTIDDLCESQIQNAIKLVQDKVQPKLTYRIYSKDELKDISFEGHDIHSILDQSQFVVFMAATLSNEIIKIIHQKEITDVSFALILDACCNAAIENVCDHFETDLREEYKKQNLYVSDRFSPGYGDFPLSFQETLCSLLETQKRIGLTLTKNHILMPEKSVSAICGLSSQPFTHRNRGCEVCQLFYTCQLRIGGQVCGK